jgi:hypothetical protein
MRAWRFERQEAVAVELGAALVARTGQEHHPGFGVLGDVSHALPMSVWARR